MFAPKLVFKITHQTALIVPPTAFVEAPLALWAPAPPILVEHALWEDEPANRALPLLLLARTATAVIFEHGKYAVMSPELLPTSGCSSAVAALPVGVSVGIEMPLP